MTWIAIITAILTFLAEIAPLIQQLFKSEPAGPVPVADPHKAIDDIFDTAWGKTVPIWHWRQRMALRIGRTLCHRRAGELMAAAAGKAVVVANDAEVKELQEVMK